MAIKTNANGTKKPATSGTVKWDYLEINPADDGIYGKTPTGELADGTPVWHDENGAYTVVWGEIIRIDANGELIPNI
jgi:hypothetical protein